MSYLMQEEFYKAHTNEIQHTLFSIFFQASNNESLIIWVPRYQRVLDFKYLIFTFLYWSYICQRSKGHVECWSIWLVVRAAQRTSILDLDSGTWVRNVIFSRLDDNLVGRSVDHPRCCRRWSVGHLRCCEDGGNLRFSRQPPPRIWLGFERGRSPGRNCWGRARCLVPRFYGRTPLSGRLSCKNFTPTTAEWRGAQKDRTGNFGGSWYFCPGLWNQHSPGYNFPP